MGVESTQKAELLALECGSDHLFISFSEIFYEVKSSMSFVYDLGHFF